jgi:ADP-ribose pyrophosphatase YjhB (NUDIX family)
MNYCNLCGAKVHYQIPQGDTFYRYICTKCKTIHYQNPTIVAGSIPEWESEILLCRRAIEPRRGLWTLPAGFMENGETTLEAANRETLEEAHAEIEIISLFALFNIPHISQVYMMYRSSLLNLNFKAGAESLEVRLFSESEIPWDELAFPVINETLVKYYEDKKSGNFRLHTSDIHPTID